MKAGNSYNLLYVFEKNTIEIIYPKRYCVTLQCKKTKKENYEEIA